MDGEELMRAARRRVGLDDFGPPQVEPALTALCRSLSTEADLHPLGRFLMRTHLRELLETRLKLADAWKRAPEPAPIVRPLFVTGMPRSGSSFLHDLLAADAANRAPRVAEVMFPLEGRAAERRTAARLWWFRRLAPGADAVHPLRADSPQECEAIHSFTFCSEEFLGTCAVPTYEAWLRRADFRPVYAFQKRFLQHLQGTRTARRWVLKSPDHAHSLAALFAEFPDAYVVQTHREPAEVLASSLQLIEVLHRTFAWKRGIEARARREARVLAEAMDRLLAFREAHPEWEHRFIDVAYAELVREPLRVVDRIYAGWGRELTPAAAVRMRQIATRRGRHARRAPASDAVPAERLAPEMWRFDRYRLRFGPAAQA